MTADIPRVYLSPPDVGELETKMVTEAIASNWVAPIGPDLDAFEDELGEASNRRHAIGLTSGTAALHLAVHSLGIGSGDRVAVASFTFAASANPVVYVGAEPFFIDSEPESWNISPELLEVGIIRSRREGRPIKALVAVDLYGQCADYLAIEAICDHHGIVLIDDAAEALGSRAFGRPAASFGRIGVFSFNGNKVITTSGGGALVTDDDALAARVRSLASQAREPVIHYEHREIGFNYRLSNLLAAFGRGQLSTLADRLGRRRDINTRYRAEFADLPVWFMPIPAWSEPNHWLSTIVLTNDAPVSVEEVRLALERVNIESRPLWKPLHLQPCFEGTGRVVDGTSERLFERGLCLPSGSGLTWTEQTRVIDVVHEQLARS